MFAGFVQLGSEIDVPFLFKDSSDVPVAPSGAPAFRVYGPNGLMTAGTGALTPKESGAVTGATNASPIVITSAGHGLTTGMSVTISGVLGNTNANGTFIITVVDVNTFSLNGATGNSAYVSGGTWCTTGFYNASITPISGNGYAQGGWYDILAIATVSGVTVEQVHRFGVT